MVKFGSEIVERYEIRVKYSFVRLSVIKASDWLTKTIMNGLFTHLRDGSNSHRLLIEFAEDLIERLVERFL
jgi:hypothetical protein